MRSAERATRLAAYGLLALTLVGGAAGADEPPLEARLLENKLSLAVDGRTSDFTAMDEQLQARLRELDSYLQLVLRANEPTVLAEGEFDQLKDIAAVRWTER